MCRSQVTSGRKVTGVIRCMVSARGLQLKCAWVLHNTLQVPILMYGNETMTWKEKESSRIKNGQMDNLRGWMDRVPNARIKEL